MIRLANLREIQLANRPFDSVDGMPADAQLAALYAETQSFVRDQYDVLRHEVLPKIAEAGVELVAWDELSHEQQAALSEHFRRFIYPVLTPLTVDPAHPFPYLANLSLNLVVTLRTFATSDGEPQFALVEIPSIVSRFVELDTTDDQPARFVLTDDLIRAHLGDLFPGLEVLGAWPFRVTRNADLALEDQEVENLMQDLERELRDRAHRTVVRLEVDADMPEEHIEWLVEHHEMDPAATFRIQGPLNLSSFMRWYGLPALQPHKDPPFNPRLNPRFATDQTIFSVIRDGDVLLHHPYESFATTAELISHASWDPKVLAIKLTLYRTSGDSVIVRSLIEAAQNGKQVTAIVELKARFDEENNISWARELERAGAHVVYGMIGLKTHCKAALVVRREQGLIRRYIHLSTGNYNSSTARLYTDVGLLTCDPILAEDVNSLFNVLTSYSHDTIEGIKQGKGPAPRFEKLTIAPFALRQRFEQLIDEEIRLHRPDRPGLIRAKCNSLSDERIIRKLYEASQAGVRIELNVRGICCLRPGIPGVSETIRVVSIVDRFLEHTRVFHFGHGGQDLVFLSSADWMTRNLNRRVETLFPIEDKELRARILHEILDTLFDDNVSSWDLQPDGEWIQNTPNGRRPLRSQEYFIELARTAGIQQSAYDTTLREPRIQRDGEGN